VCPSAVSPRHRAEAARDGRRYFSQIERDEMAFDTYMMIKDGSDVKGEATATGLTAPAAVGWIEVFSFSLGASNPTTVGTTSTGLSSGKVSVSSFNIMKKTELSSAKLFSACCTGQHYETATVVLRKATGTSGGQQIFLQYDFTDVMVESIQWSGSAGGDDTPTESVSFAFAAITITYKVQAEAQGTLGTGSNASWDLTKAAMK
jgi:type VI secretion system secreted protein Hcp